MAGEPGYIDVSTGDLDGDDRPDLLVSALTDGHVLLCLNRYQSGIDIPLDFDSVSLSTSLNQTVVADMNGDGLPDLVGASPHGNAAVIAVHMTAPLLGPAARGSILDDEAPARLAIVAGNNQSREVATGLFPGTLIVEVQDANGNPLLSSSDWSVTFTSPFIPHAVFFGSFSDTFTDKKTNVSRLGANVITGARAGTYQISAVLDGHSGVEALFTMTNTPGPTHHVTWTGDDQSLWLGTDAPAPFTVTVLDQFNNPIPNVEVQFSAPGSGPSGTFGGALTVSVLTDASGRATAPDFTANSEVGSYQIVATVVNTGLSTTFDVFNDAATMTVVSGDNQSKAVASAFPSAAGD